MKRLALLLLALAVLATSGIFATGPSAQASPTTFTVNSTADPGDGTCDATECTVREAIAAANANVGTDTIAFNIPGAGPHTIQPASGLSVAQPVIIDGYTQPGASPNTNPPGSGSNAVLKVELDGSGAGYASGLRITSGSSTVRGLVINRFGDCGIDLWSAGGNTVEGNFIGTDVTGTADLGNASYGVYILGTADNTVGGAVAGAGNLISGNDRSGVFIYPATATGNRVEGNLIGTDITGAASLGNRGDGVLMDYALDNTIGGTVAEARNVISGNGAVGVRIFWGLTAMGNQVQGNFIGTDVSGTTALGNADHGVAITNGPANTIGGMVPGAGNVISGNASVGVYIGGSGSTGNQVQGNLIGTDKDGISALGNASHGVWIEWGPTLNTIGGTAAGAGNTISHNAGDGARVLGTATGNTTRGNSIHSNSGKGIENINGGNTELAPPIIDSAGGGVSGHTSPKCYPCTVEVFSDDEDEGRIYQGSAATNDDATGTWTYNVTLIGPNITATITDAAGNTSEFSAPAAYSPPAVGGIAELPEVSDPFGPNYLSLTVLAALGLGLVTAGAWYARRRRLG
jgi:titin